MDFEEFGNYDHKDDCAFVLAFEFDNEFNLLDIELERCEDYGDGNGRR